MLPIHEHVRTNLSYLPVPDVSVKKKKKKKAAARSYRIAT